MGGRLGGWIGGIGGTLLGVVGGMVGWLTARKRFGLARGLALEAMAVSARFPAGGIAALVLWQPYAVDYTCLLLGLLGMLIMPAVLRIARERRRAELRRMKALDAWGAGYCVLGRWRNAIRRRNAHCHAYAHECESKAHGHCGWKGVSPGVLCRGMGADCRVGDLAGRDDRVAVDQRG